MFGIEIELIVDKIVAAILAASPHDNNMTITRYNNILKEIRERK